MQIVVNLDPDLEALLRHEARERNLDLDRVLNDALRASLSSRARAKEHRFVQKTYPLGSGGIDLTKALALSDELEDEEVIRKMRLADGRFVAEQGCGKEGMTAHEAVDRIRELRKGATLGGGISVKELVDEGRKH
jgi:hypothetical protein